MKVWEVKRLEGGIMKRRVIRWMREETSEAMKGLFWIVEDQLSHGVSVHIVQLWSVFNKNKLHYKSHEFKSMVDMLTQQHNFVVLI